MACFGAFRGYNGGLAGLGRAGSRPSSEKGVTRDRTLWHLKFGRQETEGDSANPGPPVIPDWGQLNSIGTRASVPGDGWPFRVSEVWGQLLYLHSAVHKTIEKFRYVNCLRFSIGTRQH
jgi:hypothetical protein